MKHPVQKIAPDISGCPRFVQNEVVNWLLENAYDEKGNKIDMNALAVQNFSREDRVQFAQLIGYSLDGFGTLSYVDTNDYVMAEASMKPDALKAQLEFYETLIHNLKALFRDGVAELYDIHPDDLN